VLLLKRDSRRCYASRAGCSIEVASDSKEGR